MSSPLIYTEYPASRDLARWVACFWKIEGVVGPGSVVLHRVLPDGCADVLYEIETARRAGGNPAVVVGPISSALVLELHGRIDIMGVRMRPGAMRSVSGIPTDRLIDTVAPISEVSRSLVGNVTKLADAADFRARVCILTQSYRKYLSTVIEPDRVVMYALKRWLDAQNPDFPSVSALVGDLGMSERAFERRFVASVGLTPVRYRRLARFRSVLRLHAQGTRDWSTLAADTGFSDQSHLVRDCRTFTGLTPTEWAASQGPSAGFLQDGRVTTF
jgi:AraC-like DNA-binding protein